MVPGGAAAPRAFLAGCEYADDVGGPAYARFASSRLREAEAAEPVIGRRFAPTRWLRRSKVGGQAGLELRP
jgi:hypothetical protein